MAKEIITQAGRTVHARLQKVRAEIQKANLTKTGLNKHNQTKYFELADFLPTVTRVCDEQGIMPLFTLKDKQAVLRVINVEDPKDSLTFFTPAIMASIPQGQAIQNLGGTFTYMRRYIYMIAFEISEGDIVDQADPEKVEAARTKEFVQQTKQATTFTNEKPIADSQREAIASLSGIDPSEVPVMTMKEAAAKISELSKPKKG